MENPINQPQIDLSKTTGIETESGGKIFNQGVILRKVSRFVAGTPEDALLPIPVFYDPETNKILEDSVPPALKEEYADDII